LIALTPAGRELIDSVTGAHLTNEKRLLVALNEAEQHALTGRLRKLLSALPND
jgi:DNA-binding MarR family transcriptional regulator